ncbi:hypothetical protein D3C77_470830 [compost metagenome]
MMPAFWAAPNSFSAFLYSARIAASEFLESLKPVRLTAVARVAGSLFLSLMFWMFCATTSAASLASAGLAFRIFSRSSRYSLSSLFRLCALVWLDLVTASTRR